MTEPNFWIDNAGAIITAGAALLGTFGGGLATNWIQTRTRKAEEAEKARERDRDRQIEAVTNALGACRKWEGEAEAITTSTLTVMLDLKKLRTLQEEAYSALNIVRFIGGTSSVRGQARRVMEMHRKFVAAATNINQSPANPIARYPLRGHLKQAQQASSDLDEQARKSLRSNSK